MSTWVAWEPMWRAVLRALLGLLFVVAGSSHFGRLRAEFEAMVPRVIGNPGFWISFTGILEILGGVGLVLRPTARPAAAAVALFLVAVFPANVRAAQNKLTFFGRPQPSVAVRGTAQAALIALVLVAGFAGG